MKRVPAPGLYIGRDVHPHIRLAIGGVAGFGLLSGIAATVTGLSYLMGAVIVLAVVLSVIIALAFRKEADLILPVVAVVTVAGTLVLGPTMFADALGYGIGVTVQAFTAGMVHP